MTKERDASLAFAMPSPTDPEGSDASTSLTKELTRVEEANLGFYRAFSELDVDAMSLIWSRSPHVRCIHPGWELVIGWTDIRQSWVEIFRTVEEIEFQLEDIHVEVSGRSAWVNLIAHIRVVTDESDDFSASVVTTNIFEKIDDQWLMVLHHSSNFSDDEEEDEEEDEDDLDFDPGISGPN